MYTHLAQTLPCYLTILLLISKGEVFFFSRTPTCPQGTRWNLAFFLSGDIAPLNTKKAGPDCLALRRRLFVFHTRWMGQSSFIAHMNTFIRKLWLVWDHAKENKKIKSHSEPRTGGEEDSLASGMMNLRNITLAKNGRFCVCVCNLKELSLYTKTAQSSMSDQANSNGVCYIRLISGFWVLSDMWWEMCSSSKPPLQNPVIRIQLSDNNDPKETCLTKWKTYFPIQQQEFQLWTKLHEEVWVLHSLDTGAAFAHQRISNTP